jgi:hypothetical protein
MSLVFCDTTYVTNYRNSKYFILFNKLLLKLLLINLLGFGGTIEDINSLCKLFYSI